MTPDEIAENEMLDLIDKAAVSADAFRDELVARHGLEGRGFVSFKLIQARIAEADIAFAVWRDPTQPRGIGWKLIKGASFIRESIAVNGVGGSTWAHIVGIPCIEAAQAEAIFDAIGERDRRH